jgi:hypothetical protein
VLLTFGLARGENPAPSHQMALETEHTILLYHSRKDLEDFDYEVDYSEGGVFSRLFSSSDSDDYLNKVRNKIDHLFRRVQKILDMRKLMKKVIIEIYSDRDALRQAYARIYGPHRRSRGSEIPRSWYRYSTNTIYVNVEDVNEGILAHEMAHAIIDHYLVVRPPRATAEILARYVDTHLYD